MTIPKPIEAMAEFRQFITWRPVYRDNGKIDKIPTDYKTGKVADAHDPNIWTDYNTAAAKGNVGFVFTDDDPFWFLDIDNCLMPDGKWSPLAQELCGKLAGSAMEVSVSGKGLHVFGTGSLPKHSCDNSQAKLGLYHTKRFVAFGSGLVGNAAHVSNGQMGEIISVYFSKSKPDDAPVNWSIAPVAEWIGPADDDELIRRMLSVKSAASVFGSRATTQQLWTNDKVALGIAFPADGRDYDASSADMSLAQHLAYWTGKDCERIKQIMLRSGLIRDKWNRDDYLRRTILAAVGRQVAVCVDKPIDNPVMEAEPVDRVGETFLNSTAQKLLFHKCCYVADENKIFIQGGFRYGKEQFDAVFGGYVFGMDIENVKTTTSAWEAFTKSRAVKFPRANTSQFRPDKPPGHVWAKGNEQIVNSYWPIKVDCVRGNPGPFLEHLEKVLPVEHDREILLAYMAAVVQYPGIKFQWAPLLQGTRGNGKTLFTLCLEEAIGRQHCHRPKASEIAEKFNDWLENKIFCGVEDIYVPKEKLEVLELLKPMVTSDWQEIRGMHRNKLSRRICCNFMLNSNYKDALRMTEDNRGICIFFTSQQYVDDLKRDGMDKEYFPKLYKWLKHGGYSIVTYYLKHYKIPDDLNPADKCHRAPMTSSTTAAIDECKGTLEQEIDAAVLEGRVGFKKGWISSYFLDLLIRDIGGMRIARNKRGQILENMGYIKHSRVNNPIAPDGCKPVLFVKKHHESLTLHGADVAVAYSAAQLS